MKPCCLGSEMLDLRNISSVLPIPAWFTLSHRALWASILWRWCLLSSYSWSMCRDFNPKGMLPGTLSRHLSTQYIQEHV